MAQHPDRRPNDPSRDSGLPARLTGTDVELRYLVRSAEPAVVFSSLAHLCVPMFSDACTVDIVEHGEIAYRIDYARPDAQDAEHAEVSSIDEFDRALCTPFAWAGTGPDDTGYAGVMTHRWRTRRPDADDVARAATLARHGVATVTEERRFGDTHRAEPRFEPRRAAREDAHPDGGPVSDAIDVTASRDRSRMLVQRERRSTYQPWRCRAAT